jgi:hypothetical protein
MYKKFDKNCAAIYSAPAAKYSMWQTFVSIVACCHLQSQRFDAGLRCWVKYFSCPVLQFITITSNKNFKDQCILTYTLHL